ncbi:MAG: NAD-binding protein, partial [Sterolibacterium sp.]
GLTGRRIGEFLVDAEVSFMALDVDPHQVKSGASKGGNVSFGNAERPEVLRAAGLARARAVVIAYPDTRSAERVIRLVRGTRPDIPIVVRTSDETTVHRLKQAGATEVIPEVLEGSLMIAAETLVQVGIPIADAIGRVRAVRAERYASLREFYRDFK